MGWINIIIYHIMKYHLPQKQNVCSRLRIMEKNANILLSRSLLSLLFRFATMAGTAQDVLGTDSCRDAPWRVRTWGVGQNVTRKPQNYTETIPQPIPPPFQYKSKAGSSPVDESCPLLWVYEWVKITSPAPSSSCRRSYG